MKKPNTGILTFPMAQANVKPFSDLVNVMRPCSNNLCIIAACDENTILGDVESEITYVLIHKSGKNPIGRAFRYIWTQLKMSCRLVSLSKHVDLWVFYIGDALILPMITAKMLGKNVMLMMGGFLEKEIELRNSHIGKALKPIKKINLEFSNIICLYSPNLVTEWGMERYKDKITIAHKHFLDIDKFKIKKNPDKRNKNIGYIGRLSEEKGALNFVKAIPQIIKEQDDIEFLVGGDGPLREEIEGYLKQNKITDKVKLTGWIPHNELPSYLNELKLVVLPSYTEGLPNVMLEAMACGTLVLATPVGAIPDVIKEGESGFILEDNTPRTIAETVIRIQKNQELETVVRNARVLIKNEFTYEAAVGKFKEVLRSF